MAQVLCEHVVVVLAEYLGHDGVHICTEALASFVAQHFLYVVVGMDDFAQFVFATVDDDDCSLSVVGVLVGIVVDFGRFFEVFEDGFGFLEELDIRGFFISDVNQELAIKSKRMHIIGIHSNHGLELISNPIFRLGDNSARPFQFLDISINLKQSLPK